MFVSFFAQTHSLSLVKERTARDCDGVVVAPMPNTYPASVAARFQSVSFFEAHEYRDGDSGEKIAARCPRTLINNAKVCVCVVVDAVH